MNDRLSPVSWLVAVVEKINRENSNHPFKVVEAGLAGIVRILHRDSGAVWEFIIKEQRPPV